ncbi:MAG: alkaline phosphatase family protein [Bacillota bacterium]|jgi:hypothetical protein|nr:alkaline phosphatase family protein [Bacillota bacterium]HHT91572.1 hypothetical protein [Bacillota bacterium]
MPSHKRALMAMLLVLFFLIAELSLCRAQKAPDPWALTLTVTGDVHKEVVLTGYYGWESIEIQHQGQSQEVIPLEPVLASAGILGEQITILFSSPDGAVAEIPLEQISSTCYLRLTPEYGWQFISEGHPRQAGIKYMDYIVVKAANPGPKAPCLRLIDGTKETALTYGELFTAEGVCRMVPEREAKKGSLTTKVYSRRNLIPLHHYLEDESKTKPTALAYFGDGDQSEIDLEGFLEWRGNSADYLAPNARTRKPDIIGIWVDPPADSVMDLAPRALAALEEGRVLMILLDGLGYLNLLELQPSFLCSLHPQPARTVMPSISPVGLGAIVTGRLPKENGITARQMRTLLVDDMFTAATNMGKTASMVEGSTTVISLSIDQILNPDLNSNGSTDDEVFACAQRELADGADLVFVHFHGYDDLAHTYGPLSPEAALKLGELDLYVQELCADFTGTVFVLADHGQHPTSGSKLGDHGEFRLLDLVVPWIQWESCGEQ